MKLYICMSALLVAIVIVECTHTFLGSSINGRLVFQKDAKYNSKMMQKRVENITYALPPTFGYGKSIQGILAYDLTKSGASANVTSGGLGYSYVTIRMKSDRGKQLHYDIYIFA